MQNTESKIPSAGNVTPVNADANLQVTEDAIELID